MRWSVSLLVTSLILMQSAGATLMAPAPNLVLDEQAPEMEQLEGQISMPGPSSQNTAADPAIETPQSSGNPDAEASLQDPGRVPTRQEILDILIDDLPVGDFESPGLSGLRMLQMQPDPPEQNGTNNTVLGENHTGIQSHTHPFDGDFGVGSIWNVPFHGVARHAILSDFDRDGTPNAILGTSNGLVGLHEDGTLAWEYLLGSDITSLFEIDVDQDGVPEYGFSTLWRAQSPRVGVVDATGHSVWETITEYPILTAGPTGDGGMLAIDLHGNHSRYDEAGGQEWSLDLNLFPTGATELAAQNLGHYLGTFGDLNGDGVADSVSAGAYWYGVPIAVDNVFTIIHAVSGADGTVLWQHIIGAEPPVLGIATHILTDLHMVDARGDGTMDVAFTGQSFRWPMLYLLLVPVAGLAALALINYETYVRVVEGDSENAPTIIGGRTLDSPLVPIEVYTHLDRTDMDGDGMDEVVVLRAGIVEQILNGGSVQLEVYRLPPSATSGPTDLYLSPVTHVYNHTAVLQGTDGPDGRILMVSEQRFHDGTFYAYDEALTTLIEMDTGAKPLAAATDGTRWMVAQAGVAEQFTQMGSERTYAAIMRADPIKVQHGDYDGDGFEDVYVLAVDDTIHVLDGVTGVGLHIIDPDLDVIDFWVDDINGDRVPDLYFLRDDELGERALEFWDGGREVREWTEEVNMDELVWFDGNGDGILDVVTWYERWDDELTATNGKGGGTLWRADVDIWSIDHIAVVDFTSRPGQDVVVADDFRDMVAIDGDNGDILWQADDVDVGRNGCMGGIGPNGKQELLVLASAPFNQFMLDDDGDMSNASVLPNDVELLFCEIESVGKDALLQVGFLDNVAKAGYARIGSSAWSHYSSNFFSTFGALQILGVDTGTDRIYVGSEDHVLAMEWSTGNEVGEFVVNGPYVTDGEMVDLLVGGPKELAVLTGDGTVWLMTEDHENATEMLQTVAVHQGKQEAPEDLDEDEGEAKKKAPSVAWVLLLIALVGAARVRRK